MMRPEKGKAGDYLCVENQNIVIGMTINLRIHYHRFYSSLYYAVNIDCYSNVQHFLSLSRDSCS